MAMRLLPFLIISHPVKGMAKTAPMEDDNNNNPRFPLSKEKIF
jgi:hypothetical protein